MLDNSEFGKFLDIKIFEKEHYERRHFSDKLHKLLALFIQYLNQQAGMDDLEEGSL